MDVPWVADVGWEARLELPSRVWIGIRTGKIQKQMFQVTETLQGGKEHSVCGQRTITWPLWLAHILREGSKAACDERERSSWGQGAVSWLAGVRRFLILISLIMSCLAEKLETSWIKAIAFPHELVPFSFCLSIYKWRLKEQFCPKETLSLVWSWCVRVLFSFLALWDFACCFFIKIIWAFVLTFPSKTYVFKN